MKKEIPESYIRQTELLMSKDRNCVVCGVSYKGAKVICESEVCWHEMDARRRENQYKYGPVNSMPPAGVFYWDYANLDGYHGNH